MSPESTNLKYRSRRARNKVIAFSIAYQPEIMLARGMGLEHLSQLLVRLARPMLRQQAILAYGGNWKDTEDNFTLELLRLISAEQQDKQDEAGSLEQQDDNVGKGRPEKQAALLYNHSSWPNYLDITTQTEAQWINCCRIICVSQEKSGISRIVKDDDAWYKDAYTSFNTAVTLSAMRQLMMKGTSIRVPDVPQEEQIQIHPVVARILLGGKADSYSGFLPGIFEEALVTFQEQERRRPVYILGGFGGAAELLARAILDAGPGRPEFLTLQWHTNRNAQLKKLLDSLPEFTLPPGFKSTEGLLDDLFEFVAKARTNLSGTLNTGLSDDQTRRLLETQDIATAVRLVRTGLVNNRILRRLTA